TGRRPVLRDGTNPARAKGYGIVNTPRPACQASGRATGLDSPAPPGYDAWSGPTILESSRTREDPCHEPRPACVAPVRRPPDGRPGRRPVAAAAAGPGRPAARGDGGPGGAAAPRVDLTPAAARRADLAPAAAPGLPRPAAQSRRPARRAL